MNAPVIYTDGSYKSSLGAGGWGVAIERDGHTDEFCGGSMETTNNRMEMQAAIEGLRRCADGEPVTLYTDSQYVQLGISQWIHCWKRKGWVTANGKPVKNFDLWQVLDREAARVRVSWQWVRGHIGVPGNELADRLASQGALEAYDQYLAKQ